MAIIPRPPSNVFENVSAGVALQGITAETNYAFTMRKVVCGGQEYAYFYWKDLPKHLNIPEYQDLQLIPIMTGEAIPSEGQFVYYQELLYPRKGFVFPEALWMVNVVKRFTISFLQAILTPWMALSLVSFLILPWFIKKRIIKNFLQRYFEFTSLILGHYMLKDSFKMAPAKELEKWISLFMQNLGFDPWLGKVIGLFVEYDSAYTLRFQDIMSEASKIDLLKNPSREFGRLLRIFAQRESRSHLNKKIGTIVLGLKILFILPRIRKAFIKAVEQVDFEKLSLSEADRYECLFYSGYDFLGRTAEDRWVELEKLHNGKVPRGEAVVGSFIQASS